MKFKDFFQETFKILPGLHLNWGKEVDFLDSESLLDIIDLLTTIQEISQNDIDYFYNLCDLLIKDTLNSKKKMPEKVYLYIEYLQFELSILPIGVSVTVLSNLSITFDWLVISLANKKVSGDQQEYYPYRIFDFLFFSHENLRQRANTSVIEWMYYLYYYSRKTGALIELADILFINSKRLMAQIVFRSDTISTLCQMACWGSIYKREETKSIINFIEGEYHRPSTEVPSKLKVIMGITLASKAGELSSMSSENWALNVLDTLPDEILPYEKLQLISTIVCGNSEKLADLEQEIYKTIRDILTYFKEAISRKAGEYLSPIFGKARTFDILEPILRTALESGKSDIINKVLVAWYQIEESTSLTSILYCFPSHPENVGYLTSEMCIYKGEREISLSDIIEITNEFLGENMIVKDDLSFKPYIPERNGVPQIKRGKEFETKLINYYRLYELINYIDFFQDSQIGFLMIPPLRHPIQPLFEKYLEINFPIVKSLKRPREDRSVKKALIYPAGSYFKDLETSRIKNILETFDVEVEIITEENLSVETFSACYQDSSYDLIWVISHGVFDSFHPENASIQISQEDFISLEQLASLEVNSENRRLIVLNICDGGSFCNLGALYELGIAPVLTKDTQAVISHIWPIEIKYALLFGIILCYYLVNDHKFFTAFRNTLKIMTSETKSIERFIIERLEDKDLVGTLIRNNHTDIENIYYWGSPIFYE